MIIVGIDPSLTGTGIARVDTNDRLVVETQTIVTKGSAEASLEEKRDRLHRIAVEVVTAAWGADLILIETPAMSKSNTGTSMLNGLFWLLVDRLDEHLGHTPVPVGIGTLKKYATGKGNAGKDEVLLAVARRYPHVNVTDNNQADSLVLAAAGADWLGYPLVDLPQSHRAALDKVQWPDMPPTEEGA